MAFRAVFRDQPAFELSDVADGDKYGYMISVLIAENAATTQRVFMDASLVHIYEQDFWEFSFTISVIALDGSCEEFATQDGRIASGYIPRKLRSFVLELVQISLRLLIGRVKPELVYRVTKGRDLPEKALRKHHLLTETLVECGYKVQESGTDQHGRTFWLCERV
jgi:hypothetical protein